MILYEPKEIICPVCSLKAGMYDGRSTVDKECRCRMCGKLLVYHVKNGVVEVKDIPERMTSSGMRFY